MKYLGIAFAAVPPRPQLPGKAVDRVLGLKFGPLRERVGADVFEDHVDVQPRLPHDLADAPVLLMKGQDLLVLRDASGAVILDCGTGQLVSTTSDQEIVEVCLSGGSGFGSAYERPLAAIARDLAEGYVTPEAAVRDYGVVVGADGKLDEASSARRREPGRFQAGEVGSGPGPGRRRRRSRGNAP